MFLSYLLRLALLELGMLGLWADPSLDQKAGLGGWTWLGEVWAGVI